MAINEKIVPVDIEDEMKKMKLLEGSIVDADKFSILERKHWETVLLLMNFWESFSFLVNNKEITDKKIIKYYIHSLRGYTNEFFNRYPKYENIKMIITIWKKQKNGCVNLK